MKLTIWIRPDENGAPTIRTDLKWESRDTPIVQHFGRELASAIQGMKEPNR